MLLTIQNLLVPLSICRSVWYLNLPVIVTTLYLGTVTERLPVEDGFSFLRYHFTLELEVYETILS